MSIKVFTAEEARNSINDHPERILSIEKKKETKAYKGTTFLNALYDVDSVDKEGKKQSYKKAAGWFRIEDVPLSCGVADPEDKNDKRNEFEGTRLQLQTTVSRAGAIGEFLEKLNVVFKTKVDALVADGTINLDKKEVHGIVQTHYSSSHKEKPNEPMEDPIIRFKIDFSVHPPTYPHKFLRGKPKTTFLDYDQSYTDENGNVQYRAAMVENENGDMEPVTPANLHKFVTKGSVIRRGRIMMPSVPVSKAYVSLPIVCGEIVLETGAEAGFSDDAATCKTNANVKAALTTTQTSTETTASVQSTEVANASTADDDAINAALAEI